MHGSSKERKEEGMSDLESTFWRMDLESYIRSCKMMQNFNNGGGSEKFKQFLLGRMARLRDKYPTHYRIFDDIDREHFQTREESS